MSGRAPKTSFLQALLLISVTLLVVFVCLEIVWRLLPQGAAMAMPRDVDGESIYQPDSELGYKMRPDFVGWFRRAEFDVSVRTNRHGNRDDPPPDDACGRAKLVAGFGDSFGVGHGVEQAESFFEHAEARLRDIHPSISIQNFSVSGYAQRRQLMQLERAARLGARIWVVAVHTGNDILENGAIIDRRFRSGGAVTPEVSRGRTARFNPVAESKPWVRSLFLEWVRARFNALPRNLNVGLRAWYVFDLYRSTPSERTRAAYTSTRVLLDSMREKAKVHGARLVLLTIPALYEVDVRVFEKAARAHGVSLRGMDNGRVVDFYEAYARNHSLPFLDMRDVFLRSSFEPTDLYFASDRHFNVKGHRLTGEHLANLLRREFGEILAMPCVNLGSS